MTKQTRSHFWYPKRAISLRWETRQHPSGQQGSSNCNCCLGLFIMICSADCCLVDFMWITVIPIIRLFCFPHKTSRLCISYSQSNIQGASITFVPSSYSCNVPNASKRFPDSGTFCWLLRMLASIHLLWNSIPFVIYFCSHCRTRIASRNNPPAKAATQWFPKQYWSHYDLHHSRQRHDLQCTSHVPAHTTPHQTTPHHTTPHPTKLTSQVDCHLNLIFFEWTLLWLFKLTPSLRTITFSTMMMILIPFLETWAIRRAGHLSPPTIY